ncbi:MAG TPA: MotA/TolQ/ExbB proton channel family protein [Pararobbsia sp.]|jgi:biopolymer transport protein TolQ|nr:MotA/TolQ/ExbB proton channel family protein [Pararobbsia sp.]
MNAADISAHLSPWHLFLNADIIVKAIMVLLTLASVASWGVVAEKLTRLHSLQKRSRTWLAELGNGRSLSKLSTSLREHAADPFARIYGAIIGEWRESHRNGFNASTASADGLKERINRVASIATGIEVGRLQRGLPILATVGSVAPFVGLFGTVWGIMNAFQGIAASNNTSLSVVAPGIAEALFATALGLVAAIPAVIAYNRASGDLNEYANSLGTLTGIVEVHLSRLIDAGETLVETPDSGSTPQGRAATLPASNAGAFASRGA